MVKLNFQQLLLQSSLLHDPAEIILVYWFGDQETCFLINVENSCAFLIVFVETAIHLFE